MRTLVIVIFGIFSFACEPEIGTGTYYCGENSLCPPELACDGPTFTCVTEGTEDPFECVSSVGGESNADMDSAFDLGDLQCGDASIQGNYGCIAQSGDS